MVHLPRIMVAAPSSGSGKTMIACGLLQALLDRGLSPCSFKCGPDYIDPMFHTKVIGTKSRNLDTFFTDRGRTRYLFSKTAVQAGISVLEGVMGMYDGLGGVSASASSYELAAVTDTPVVLVVNAKGMSLSAAALIHGYADYQKRLGKQVIRGVILNQTTKMTYQTLRPVIEEQTGIKVYGYVPRLPDCAIESRHLGLVLPDEIASLRQSLKRLGRELESCLDLDGLIALAGEAPDYKEEELITPPEVTRLAEAGKGVRIAVASDEAFCFYYEDNLELLRMLGARIETFSPLHDDCLPEGIGGLILGGGYPELYADKLSQNESMRRQIKEAIGRNLPYLAECGGFMYLHDEMEDMEGKPWPMCGCIGGRSYKTPKLGRFGYITLNAKQKKDQLLLYGEEIRGHEFHYFDSTNPGEDFTARKPTGTRSWDCVHAGRASAAGYPHLYYWSNVNFAARFAERAVKYAGL